MLTLGYCLAAITPLAGQQLFDISGSTLYPLTRRAPVDWQELNTPHFSVIYPSENAPAARETGRILEAQYEEGQRLVGGSLNDLPVILNPYNDQSNGFVSALNFRMEVDLHPMQGKVLNPESGNWMEAVLPHELIHALHGNHHAPGGFTGLLQLLSPDLARSVHTAVPMGVHEGLAVYHETESVLSGGGRGQYSYFEGPFETSFRSGDPWSLGQHLQPTDFTRPFNRHYIGGYEFTAWLQETHGPSTSREAIHFYSRFPFLGYGWALRHVTGKWPSELYRDFADSTRSSLKGATRSPAPTANAPSFTSINLPFNGAEVRRPLWISDSTLLFHGSFYNARPGFYRYDLNQNEIHRLFATRLVEDYRYDLASADGPLFYARYHAHPYHDRRSDARIHTFPFNNDSRPSAIRRRSTSPRSPDFSRPGFAPAFVSGHDLPHPDTASITPHSTLWSIKHSGTSTVLARHLQYTDPKRDTTLYYSPDSTSFTAVQPHPQHPDTLAIVANRRGVQGLWFTRTQKIEETLKNPPDIAFEAGSIFDPSWHPIKDHLLFTSDHSGTMQIYEFRFSERSDTELTASSSINILSNGKAAVNRPSSNIPTKIAANGSVYQITRHRRNAFEASFNPSGDRIAYVLQQTEITRIALLNEKDFLNRKLPRRRWSVTPEVTHKLDRPIVGDSLNTSSLDWSATSYQPGYSWLKPRTVIPTLNTDVEKYGLQFYSTTPLQRQNYKAQISYGMDRLWYDLNYYNAVGIPPFEIGVSRQPQLLNGIGNLAFMEHQQYQLASSIPLTFNRNVFNTRLQLRPSLNYHLYRAYNNQHTPVTNFSRYLTFHLESQFSYRLQQNLRDIQPNSGIHLIAEGRYDLKQWNATKRRGTRLGGYLFLSPLRRFNQSLRVGTEWIYQSTPRVFNTNQLGMSGFRPALLSQSRNLFQFSSRYTIPLWHPDNGGFLVPLYMSRLYLVGFSQTVGSASMTSLEQTRSIYGGGLRVTFRLSNLTFDIGIALSVEPTRDDYYGFIGTF